MGQHIRRQGQASNSSFLQRFDRILMKSACGLKIDVC